MHKVWNQRLCIWKRIYQNDNVTIWNIGKYLLIKNAFQIPLMSDITKYSDLGSPVAFVLP